MITAPRVIDLDLTPTIVDRLQGVLFPVFLLSLELGFLFLSQ